MVLIKVDQLKCKLLELISHAPNGLACYILVPLTCAHLIYLLQLQHSDCFSNWEKFEDYPDDFQEF
jgi:hypothetical protein